MNLRNRYLFLSAILFFFFACVLGNNVTHHSRKKRSVLLPFKTICYGELGCFSNGPPFFNPVWRPISLLPLPPALLATYFLLYTRRNREEAYGFSAFDMEKILNSPFNSSACTKIIIHGWVDSISLTGWTQELKENFLDLYDDNIILLDLFPYPSYSQFATNTRVLAAQITQLIRFIEKAYGYPPEKFYLLGHSFGAHTAGYIGERIPNIGRITGMDPAGPLFQYTDKVVKLESTDAPFVDNIHTNPGFTIFDGLGTFEDTGHVDFWPDNALSRGCPLTLLRIALTGRIFPDFIENLPYCRHFRATEFMIFSFGQNGCYFVGVECRSWDSFLEGQCNCGNRGERCRFMGVFSTPAPHKTRYYLRTGFERPYCLHQYQVIVFFELLSEQMTYESVEIVLELLLEGETKIQEKVKLNINLIVKKQVHRLLVTSKSPLGRATVAAATLYRPINIKTIKQNTRTEFGAVVEAIEINYLFPSPKEETYTLLCWKETLYSGMHKQHILSTTSCDEFYECRDAARNLASRNGSAAG